MPIYEYQCIACGHKLEAIQKISEEPLTLCPSCDQDQLQKLVSAAGFQLKGGGWYVTDYSAKGKEKSKSKKGAEGDSKPSSTETKTDTSSSSGKVGE
jgi:putative FmdB family regulatory protein